MGVAEENGRGDENGAGPVCPAVVMQSLAVGQETSPK
jgi:hypothetical protein